MRPARKATMQINISLAPKGPAMWFLGTDTQQLVAHLTFEDPGPISLDFDDLTEGEQLHLLASQRAKQIEVSIPFNELRQYYVEGKEVPVQKAQEVPTFVKDTLTKLNERNEVQDKRAKELVSLGIKGFRSAIADETDLRLLKRVAEIEVDLKNRKTALKIINDRIQALQKQILKKVNDVSDEAVMPVRRDAVSYDDDVIESEQKTISFTLE